MYITIQNLKNVAAMAFQETNRAIITFCSSTCTVDDNRFEQCMSIWKALALLQIIKFMNKSMVISVLQLDHLYWQSNDQNSVRRIWFNDIPCDCIPVSGVLLLITSSEVIQIVLKNSLQFPQVQRHCKRTLFLWKVPPSKANDHQTHFATYRRSINTNRILKELQPNLTHRKVVPFSGTKLGYSVIFVLCCLDYFSLHSEQNLKRIVQPP